MSRRALFFVFLSLLFNFGAQAEEAKLATDDVVRVEMKAIRDLTLNAHTLVTHRRMPPADARVFHSRIKAAVERLQSGTSLTGAAKTEIAQLTSEISKGAAAVARAEPNLTPIDGIVAIDEALSLYAIRFDHPGWQPLR